MKILTPVVVVSALLAPAAPLYAQLAPAPAPPPREERPYRGLFGGGVDDAEQLLTFNSMIGAGYNKLVRRREAADAQPLSVNGPYGLGSASLSYSLQRESVSLGAALGTNAHYFTDAEEVIKAYNGSVGGSWRIAERSRLSASQTASQQPFQALSLFPALFDAPIGQIGATDLDLRFSDEDYRTYTTSADFSQDLSRRASLTANVGYTTADFESQDQSESNRAYTSRTAAARFNRGVTRDLGIRVGYGLTETLYGRDASERRLRRHTYDIGVDYNRALTFTRRTTLSFSTGTTALGDGETTHYDIIGSARLNREIGRTWNATLSYNRNVTFLDTFSEPVSYDGVTFGVRGLVSRRLEFRSTLGASMGNVGYTEDANGFETYHATAGLVLGLTRHFGLGTDYTFYRYSFDSTLALPTSLQQDMDRHGARAYVTVWLPLLHTTRRPDASR